VSNDVNKLVGGLLFDLNFNHLNVEEFLELSDLSGCGVHGFKTDFEAGNLVSDLGGFGTEQVLVERNELKERSGGRVVETTALNQEIIVGLSNGHVNECHVGGDGLS
jgi:hypothetical protein